MPEAATGCYLGIDYGTQYIGIAVGQTISGSANPLAVIPNKNHSYWKKLDQLIREWQPIGLVVGMPETADGKETSWIKQVRQFVSQLEGRTGLPIHTISEHLSTQAAKDLLNGAVPRKMQRLDDTAAAVILQTWLHQHDDRH